jgi:hypothetical protein
MYASTYDWGNIDEHKFEARQLESMNVPATLVLQVESQLGLLL